MLIDCLENTGVMCDREMHGRLKGNVFYTAVVRPATLYGLDTVKESGQGTGGGRNEDA